MSKEEQIEKSASTEGKIKEAARRVFTRKGYAATRTRDIAEESGYNVALINYYFRSKEKLFDLIMLEHLQLFVSSVHDHINDPTTSLPQKLEILISHYIDMLIKNPDLPVFVLHEINANPKKFIEKVGFDKINTQDIYLVQQWKMMAAAGKVPPVNPIHFLMNAVSMTIFPFIASPLIRDRMEMTIEDFNALMEERKKLIPAWIKSIMHNPQPH